jgi:hypothetical protein
MGLVFNRGFAQAVTCAGAVLMFAALLPAATPQRLGPAVRRFEFHPDPATHVVAADYRATIGWSFRTNSRLCLTHLGYFDMGRDGLMVSHRVGIWNSNGKLLASAVVPAGEDAMLWRQYRYVPTKPLLLPAGRTYILGATAPENTIILDVQGGDPPLRRFDLYPFYQVPGSSVRVDKRVTLLSSALTGVPDVSATIQPPGTLVFPTKQHDDAFGFAPNMLLEDAKSPGVIFGHGLLASTPEMRPGSIPEPGTVLIMIAGAFVLGRRRPRGPRGGNPGRGTVQDETRPRSRHPSDWPAPLGAGTGQPGPRSPSIRWSHVTRNWCGVGGRSKASAASPRVRDGRGP